jgi:hypothetical protein
MDAHSRQKSETLSTQNKSPLRSNSFASVDSSLSEKYVSDFKILYQNKYGSVLSPDEAKEKALKLLSFLRRIGYPLGEKHI